MSFVLKRFAVVGSILLALSLLFALSPATHALPLSGGVPSLGATIR